MRPRRSSKNTRQSPSRSRQPGIRIGKGVPGTFAGDFQQAVTTKLTALYGKDFAAKYDTNASVSRLDTGKLTALIEADSVDAAIVFAAEIGHDSLRIVTTPSNPR